MKTPTLRDEWISLAEVMFCGLESEIQYIETQKAFYAGAMSFYNIMIKVAENDMSAAQVASVLESIRSEFLEFSKTIKQ